MQEILGYNADIICLQEVDEKAFATYFQPMMSYAGASLPHALLTQRKTNVNPSLHCRHLSHSLRDCLPGSRIWGALHQKGWENCRRISDFLSEHAVSGSSASRHTNEESVCLAAGG